MFHVEREKRDKKNRGLPAPILTARKHLKAGQWSYRAAAPKLGVTYQWLSDVLNNRRGSQRLLRKIVALPPRRTA